MTDEKALRQKVADKGIKLTFIAEQLGLSYQGFSNKLTNKSEFSVSEVATICELLNLSLKEKENIFFRK